MKSCNSYKDIYYTCHRPTHRHKTKIEAFACVNSLVNHTVDTYYDCGNNQHQFRHKNEIAAMRCRNVAEKKAAYLVIKKEITEAVRKRRIKVIKCYLDNPKTRLKDLLPLTGETQIFIKTALQKYTRYIIGVEINNDETEIMDKLAEGDFKFKTLWMYREFETIIARQTLQVFTSKYPELPLLK